MPAILQQTDDLSTSLPSIPKKSGTSSLSSSELPLLPTVHIQDNILRVSPVPSRLVRISLKKRPQLGLDHLHRSLVFLHELAYGSDLDSLECRHLRVHKTMFPTRLDRPASSELCEQHDILLPQTSLFRVLDRSPMSNVFHHVAPYLSNCIERVDELGMTKPMLNRWQAVY
ncbi:hypothetical protein CVT25_014592 [Psilocybe cyanescens]|uniref:Uncharacterized protein n=1 Tax=Psilocybe cyanescens TaxID=93625 RepID=A0A409XRC4_PSICY|nr:hypothetical protein CVT25_014592 [Psilocybe cyanescens]